MKTMKSMETMVAIVFAAVAVNAADIAEEVKALQAEIASNSVDRSTKCAYYRAWFVDQCSKAEHDAILARNMAAHHRWMELEPKNAAARVGLGITLATVGRWEEAKKTLEPLLSYNNSFYRARALWELANCRWQDGDREGAKKLLAEFLDTSKNWPSGLGAYMKRANYLLSMLDDSDADMDMLKLPHLADRKPFPTPQKASYGEKGVALSRVELKVLGLRPDDSIVRLLKKKLTRFGSKFQKGGTKVEVAISPTAPVDNPQGYSLDVAKGNVSIKARDRLGALWGVVSLLQCVDRDALSVCECSILDWPVCLRRGANTYWETEILEYALFNKMSMMDITMGSEWSIAPLDRERHRLTALHFIEFGIETRFTIRSVIMEPMVPLSSPRTRKIHLSFARFFASLGVGAKFDFDDSRFPMHPLDLKNAGTAANLDAKYLTGIYRDIKKDYPDFCMMFCPPFYWGPDGGVNYPEPREPYLKSLAADLDPDIEVVWTGPRVKTGNIKPKSAAWITNLIGRKPVIISNGNSVGQHSHVSYGADPSVFKKSHCPEIFDLVAAFQMNMSAFSGADGIGSCADWCWNPDAHDPLVAVRRTIEQVEGPGVSEALAAAIPDLTYLDKYTYGRPSVEVLTEDQSHLDRLVALADKT